MHEKSDNLFLRRGGENMATTNLNIRIDKDVKDKSDAIFSELGLTMTSAINIFLRTAIREHGIPFSLKLEEPNETTIAAIEEGKKIAKSKKSKSYHSVEELREDLGV